eukprot:7495790-Alexandrium_andersonii.AAC.1
MSASLVGSEMCIRDRLCSKIVCRVPPGSAGARQVGNVVCVPVGDNPVCRVPPGSGRLREIRKT